MPTDPMPISGLTTIASLATTDVVPVIDVSDTTESANGTTRKATIAQIVALASSTGLTSVGLTMPAIFSVASSPLTANGTIAVTLATQLANAVLAGPTTGSAAAPTFRALVAGDIPAIAESQVTNLVSDLAAKAADASVVHLTGNETIAGTKTFSAAIAGSVTGTAANITGIAAIANGGTGQATAAAAFNALSPLTTLGDVLYASAPATAARLAGNTAATKKFLTQTGTGTVSAAPAWGTISTSDLPSTGLTITSWTSPIGAPAWASTVTFDLSANSRHMVTLGGATTLALSNVQVGMTFTLILVQDATGSRTVTWFSGIKWNNATAPTLATAAGRVDVFTFICTGSGQYLGFQAGQAMG